MNRGQPDDQVQDGQIPMKILIIGGGGREHALAWKVAQSKRVQTVYVAPGNAGTAREPKLLNVAIRADNVAALLAFAQENTIDLTIVGPETPLVLGIVDAFQDANQACFGPVKAAAQLEGSKSFSKDFLQRHHIPTAAYATFTDLNAALAYVRRQTFPLVIKADGLAAGKGVIIAADLAEAEQALVSMLTLHQFGSAGAKVVIEEFLQGEEASFIVMADGLHALPLATSQDHKARDNADRGPNTGGMGAYSPAPVVTPEIHQRIMATVIYPTLAGLAAEGIPYTGFLYAGLMIDPQGIPKVLEFNCRFGDPETQPIMMRLKSDMVELCQAALAGRLNTVAAVWDERVALGVVLAAGGYPDAYAMDEPISGLELAIAEDAKVFHAGTRLHHQQVVTAGGRVLCVVALGDSVQIAQNRAYEISRKIHWKDMYYRNDIGYRAIAREKSP